jgi:hypothetical protein
VAMNDYKAICLNYKLFLPFQIIAHFEISRLCLRDYGRQEAGSELFIKNGKPQVHVQVHEARDTIGHIQGIKKMNTTVMRRETQI